MPLKVTSTEKEPGVFMIVPEGSLDTNTYSILEKRVDMILEGQPRVIALDMAYINYISSMGVRVVIKTRKALKQHDGNLVVLNLQPQVRKVFEIINALPSEQVFASTEELDKYLDRMQKKMTGN
ncbi:STAS domain-containing protein [Desulfobacterota bacterium AH_259_B03_O07]|nr:STAS domain-containing protein [Desulfobacterota bacterium AH_259_B03_O07]